MSILLESLGKEMGRKDTAGEATGQPPHETDNQSARPVDLNTRHFDDEYDQEDVLRQSRNRWRLSALGLLVLLLLSWGWFVSMLPGEAPQNQSEALQNQNDVPQNQNDVSQNQNDALQNNLVTQTGDQVANSSPPEAGQRQLSAQPISDGHNQIANGKKETALQPKPVWKPRKLAEVKATSQNQSIPLTKDTTHSAATIADKPRTQPLVDNKIYSLQTLPESVRENLPPLEVSSFVIADPKDKSFVLLNGQIYGIGEMIAPHLKLKDISQEQITVQYQQYLIALPTQQ